MLAAVLSAIAFASDSPERRLGGMTHVHLDILIEGLNFGRMTDMEEQALRKDLAKTIASKLGARSEDIMTFAKERGSVKILRGTTLFEWLPESWPARKSPSGETTLIACVVRLQKSTMFIAESATNNPRFKEEVVESCGHALGSSQAITGSMSVVADYIGPVNPEEATEDSFTGGGKGGYSTTPRPPWATGRFHVGGGVHVNWIQVLVVVVVLLLIAVCVGAMHSQRRRERSGGFLAMLGREPPRETWRDKLHDFMSPYWKKPVGGYGITGH